MRGSISSSAPLISPIHHQEAVIVGITMRVYKEGKGWGQKDSYCFLAEDAMINIEGNDYLLYLEKEVSFHKDIPFRAQKANGRPLIISENQPKEIPSPLRKLHPRIEDYIRVLRKDAPTSLSVPYLKSIELSEWYYEAEQTIKIRVELRNDTAFFQPKGLL